MSTAQEKLIAELTAALRALFDGCDSYPDDALGWHLGDSMEQARRVLSNARGETHSA
jgi:hypothetical protein